MIVVDKDGNDVTERHDCSLPNLGVPDPSNLPTTRIDGLPFSASDSLAVALENSEQSNGIPAESIRDLATATTPGTVRPSREVAWWDMHCDRSPSRLCLGTRESPDKERRGTNLSTPAPPNCGLREGQAQKHGDDIKALEKLSRTEQRRMRNRASAQRCNLRRKEERDAI